MNTSKSDLTNDVQRNAGHVSAQGASTQDAGQSNGGNTEKLNSTTGTKDKDINPQGHQSPKTQAEHDGQAQDTHAQKADGAASDKTDKEAAAEEGSESSERIAPASEGGSHSGKPGESSSGLSAKPQV